MKQLPKSIALFVGISLLCISCKGKENPEGGKKDDPKPVVTTPVLLGSFDQKWNRYSEGEKHPGESDSKKIETTWRDTLWRGDRAHKQLILWSTGKTVRNISVNISNLSGSKGVLPASAIHVRYGTYITGDQSAFTCGEGNSRQSARIADGLSEIPVSSFTTSDPLKMWVTVDIPKETSPGKYSGSIDVVYNNETVGKYNMDFLVVDHLLPDVSDWTYHLDIWQFPFQLASLCKVEPFSPEYYTLVKPFYTLLADAGQKAITAYIKDGAFTKGYSMIDWTKTSTGGWEFDYSKFDSFVTEMMALGIDDQINCFSMIGWDRSIGYKDAASGSQNRYSADIGSDNYNKIWNIFLNSFKNHLLEKGWFDKAVLYMDEVSENDLEAVIDIIKANDPDWKVGVAGSWYSRALTKKLYDHSPIITCTEETDASIRTFYTSCSQAHPNNYVSEDSDPAEMIWMAWHALASGYDGYLRWAFDYWTMTDPLNAQDGSNCSGDFHFLYRTSNTASTCQPMSSVRFELLRDGIQDYEKVKILGKNKFSTVSGLFTTTAPTKAYASVNKAEALLKQLSVTQ